MNSTNFSIDHGLNVTCPKPGTSEIPLIRIFIGYYVFPWLLIIGITGNILNLLVLNSKGMRTKTNALLSAMAVADLAFLFLMLPVELRVFQSVASNSWYRHFLAHHKMTLTFGSNWMATASTWMALAVTAERVFAIKMPLHAKFYWKQKRIAILVFSVYVTTLLLHLYNLFWFRLSIQQQLCTNGTFAFAAYVLTPVTPNDPAYTYVQASRIYVPQLSITFPFFVLVILNAFLLYYLHQNRRAMADATNAPQLRQNELRVGVMVAMIVFTFTICSAPSVGLYIYDAIVTFAPRPNPYSDTWYVLSALSNCLVAVGKASNFVLYCSASSHFRRRLARMFCKRYATPIRGSSRASTSLRRTTLSSLFASAFADFHPNHHRGSYQRTSVDNALAGGAPVSACNRRKSAVSFEDELVEMKIDSPNKTVRQAKDFIGMDGKRRHSSQKQRRRQDNQIKQPMLGNTRTGTNRFTLERRRFSSPDQSQSTTC